MSLPPITRDTMEESLMYVREDVDKSIHRPMGNSAEEWQLAKSRLKLLGLLIKQERKFNPRFP